MTLANKKADAIDMEVVVEAVRKGTTGLAELKKTYEPLGLSEKAEEHYYRIQHKVVHIGWEKVFVREIDSETQ